MTIDPGTYDAGRPMTDQEINQAFWSGRMSALNADLEQYFNGGDVPAGLADMLRAALIDRRLEPAHRAAPWSSADLSVSGSVLVENPGPLLDSLRTIARHVQVQELLEQRSQNGWCVEYPQTQVSLPSDFTGGRWPNMCTARLGQEWSCTRIAAHTGRHAAGSGEHIVAVWGDACRTFWRLRGGVAWREDAR